jgi:hypothetical protein
MRAPHLDSGGRYPVLRAFGILCLVMSIAAMFAGIVGAAWAIFRAPLSGNEHLVVALSALAGMFFLVVTNLAVAEIVKLFLDIEHNTRTPRRGNCRVILVARRLRIIRDANPKPTVLPWVPGIYPLLRYFRGRAGVGVELAIHSNKILLSCPLLQTTLPSPS